MLNPAEANQNSPKYNEGKVTLIFLGAFPPVRQPFIRAMSLFTDSENLKRGTGEVMEEATFVAGILDTLLKDGAFSSDQQETLNQTVGYLKGVYFHLENRSSNGLHGITNEEFSRRLENEAIPIFRKSLTIFTGIDCNEGQVILMI